MDDKTKPTTLPSPPPDLIEVCAACGTVMVRKMFRTGSVDHPGKDLQVCPQCGTRH
jgi:hypothetical protein